MFRSAWKAPFERPSEASADGAIAGPLRDRRTLVLRRLSPAGITVIAINRSAPAAREQMER